MKKPIILIATLSMVSCTTVKRDDHSYSYVYHHNDRPSEAETPRPRNVEYTTYKQEYSNYKNSESNPDSEFLDHVNKREVPVYSGDTNPQPQVQRNSYPQSKKDFNPYDNQFINSSCKVNKNMEEKVPDIFGPEGYVTISSKVPNSNPPIINTYYYPASNFR